MANFTDSPQIEEHQIEARRREIEEQHMRDWKRLKTAQGGTPHFPIGLQYVTLALLSFCLFFTGLITVTIILTRVPQVSLLFGGMSWVLCVALYRIGLPYQIRDAAQRLHTWDNPALIETLCQMLTWADADIRGYARASLTRLLPQLQPDEQVRIDAASRDALCKMLNANTARREPQLVIAILEAFERMEVLDAIPAVSRLLKTPPSSFSAHVREVAQHCLNSLQSAKQRQSHQSILLRPTSQTATDFLLTPASAPSTTAPEELLRPTAETQSQTGST